MSGMRVEPGSTLCMGEASRNWLVAAVGRRAMASSRLPSCEHSATPGMRRYLTAPSVTGNDSLREDWREHAAAHEIRCRKAWRCKPRPTPQARARLHALGFGLQEAREILLVARHFLNQGFLELGVAR